MQPTPLRSIGLLLVVLACGLTACDRGSNSSSAPARPAADLVKLPNQKPEYDFADGLEDEYPQIVAFMRQFLETCLAGDYTGYRHLVTRTADPESRARFRKVLHSLQSLTIQSIQEGELPDAPGPIHLVICQAEFRADDKTALRRGRVRRIAIVVLEEEGEYRMGLAPPEYQPEDDEPAPTTAPASSAPSYPWDEDVDY